MPAVKLSYKSPDRSKATFKGVVEPDGATGYKFSGTLKASCPLNRDSVDFKNAVRLEHGGSSTSWHYLEFALQGNGTNEFAVTGKGERAAGDTIEFCFAFNEGLSGQFKSGAAKRSIVGGPPQKISPEYKKDVRDNLLYDVRFTEGTARADGPKGFVIEGTLDASGAPGTLLTQYATFGYKSSSDGWSYKTFAINDTPQRFKVSGTRKAGESIKVVVGATSKIGNTYGYGPEVECALPEQF